MGLILITHDLGVVAEVADEVLVMYAGNAVEQGSVREIFAHPQMPYTRGLLNSIPKLSGAAGKKERLETIPGIVPNLLRLPKGCRFQERCSFVQDVCREQEPPLRKIAIATESDTVGVHAIRCARDL
jgi:oligopeptide/dipeptide ABC transporter ATP-binding protein